MSIRRNLVLSNNCIISIIEKVIKEGQIIHNLIGYLKEDLKYRKSPRIVNRINFPIRGNVKLTFRLVQIYCFNSLIQNKIKHIAQITKV